MAGLNAPKWAPFVLHLKFTEHFMATESEDFVLLEGILFSLNKQKWK